MLDFFLGWSVCLPLSMLNFRMIKRVLVAMFLGCLLTRFLPSSMYEEIFFWRLKKSFCYVRILLSMLKTNVALGLSLRVLGHHSHTVRSLTRQIRKSAGRHKGHCANAVVFLGVLVSARRFMGYFGMSLHLQHAISAVRML